MEDSVHIDITSSPTVTRTPARSLSTIESSSSSNAASSSSSPSREQLFDLYSISPEEDLTPEELIQLQLLQELQNTPEHVNIPSNVRPSQLQPNSPSIAGLIQLLANNRPNNADNAAEAQPQAAPELNNVGVTGNLRQRTFCRGQLTLEEVYLIGVNIALIVALSLEGKRYCSHKLFNWAAVQIVLQFMMVISSKLLRRYPPPSEEEREVDAMRVRRLMFSLLNRFLNLSWFVWVLSGVIWTFEPRLCEGNSPIYTVAFVLSIWHIVLLSVISVSCCCCVNVLLFYFCCYRGGNSTKSASNKLINKTTTSKKFKEGVVPKEDATCAICLGEYEEGDKLRFLRCEHHFHSDCIITWLKKNKTCPFCKREIDEKEEEKKPVVEESRPNEVEANEVDDEEEIQLVRRN